MLDIAGTALTPEETARLRHPLTGGVILFARNYESTRQLAELTAAIRAARTPPLLIAVDHEGGRVQRFRDGFTRIPAMRELGRVWDAHPKRACHLALQTGYVLAAELRACGVDFSFTPVLDVDFGCSSVIGDRAFHSDPEAISDLAHALLQGLRQGGMQAVGKHFPGHGFVRADSHLEIPVDERSYADMELCDLIPFRRMVGYGLTAVMPAHVIYPKIDDKPAGFSEIWLKQVLRDQLGFEGCIFSDDLSMEGATVAGGIRQRAEAALHAGCDMALVCNRPDLADELLASLHWDMPAASLARLMHMRGRLGAETLVHLHEQADFVKAVHEVASIGMETGELPLA
jgi:beta-N-acetylhexosaminidase